MDLCLLDAKAAPYEGLSHDDAELGCRQVAPNLIIRTDASITRKAERPVQNNGVGLVRVQVQNDFTIQHTECFVQPELDRQIMV